MTALNTLEKDDLLRRIAWLNAEVDKIKRMLKGEQMGTARIADAAITTAKIEDAAITNAKIVDLTWDKAQGGTAKLGGLNDVDGILSVLDNSGVEKVVLDKDGVLIKSGKLVIQNDSDEISIDSKGIVSNKNFTQTLSAGVNINQVISGSSETDITNCSVSYANLRAKAIIILFNTSNYMIQSSGNTANLKVRLRYNFNGGNWVELTYNANAGVPITDSQMHTYTNFYSGSISGSGTYSFKLTAQLESITGSPTSTIYDGKISLIVLGT